MVMKKILMVLIGLMAATILSAQDTLRFSRNNLYFELGGAGVLLSGNLEHFLSISNSLILSGRAGLGFYPIELGLFGGKTIYSGIVPISASLLYGNKFSVEAGLGLSIGWDDDSDAHDNNGPIKWYNGMLGLRYQKPGKGFLFRFGYTPIMRFKNVCLDSYCLETRREILIMPYFGISMGTRLKAK
jgi:hypothetical protein